MRKNSLLITTPFLIIILDQITKYLCLSRLSLGDIHPVFPGLNFTLQFNKGAAFSFLADGQGWQRWFFVSVTFVICAGLLYWLKRTSSLWEKFSFLLILGGALGNVWDRLLYGHVVDFIDVYYHSWHFATFNVADSAICIGAFLFFLNTLFMRSKKS